MQYDKHKKAKAALAEIDKAPTNYLVIHYSCESFYNTQEGRTPRITSIAVVSFDSGQTDSFSIHKVAEKKHIPLNQIEANYDGLEKAMLEEFFSYVLRHATNYWIHWNMRDINYGFKALEHRFEVLGGTPQIIDDSRKVDLSRLFSSFYGAEYIGHPHMGKLLELNNIVPKDYLSGADEACAFEQKDFIKLHQSTSQKVRAIACLLEKAIDGTLKTQARWRNMYGISPQGIFEYFHDK